MTEYAYPCTKDSCLNRWISWLKSCFLFIGIYWWHGLSWPFWLPFRRKWKQGVRHLCDTDTVRACVCPCPSRMFCFFALTEVKDQTLTLTGGQNSVLLFWRTQERPWQWWTSRDDRKRERRKQNTSQHLSPMATGAKTFPVRADHQSASLSKRREEVQSSRYGYRGIYD